jgi:hypothetical protein
MPASLVLSWPLLCLILAPPGIYEPARVSKNAQSEPRPKRPQLLSVVPGPVQLIFFKPDSYYYLSHLEQRSRDYIVIMIKGWTETVLSVHSYDSFMLAGRS